MKAGWKTSEFWLTILSIVGSSAASFQHLLDPKWAAVVSTVGAASYAISRALVKQPS